MEDLTKLHVLLRQISTTTWATPDGDYRTYIPINVWGQFHGCN